MFWLALSSSVLLSAVLTWAVREIATKYGLVSAPLSPRHIHKRPIARLGGAAVFVSFVVVYGLYWIGILVHLVPSPLTADGLKLFGLAIPLFAAGLIDDLRGLSATTKLLVQIAGGICLYFSGFHFLSFYWATLGAGLSSVICLAATVFWVVLVCNAVNLIDGLDGLAAGASIFSMVTIFTIALAQGRTGVAMATLILAGSLGGFLLFNFNPASIFLGDGGSLFVGFLLSGFVMADAKPANMNTVLTSVISLALPLMDTALSVMRRFLSGHALFGADREHIHHKLLELGLSHRQAVLILYGFCVVCILFGLSFLQPTHFVTIPATLILILVLFFGLRKLQYCEFMEFRRLWRRVLTQRRAVICNIAIRKATAALPNANQLSHIMQLLEGCLRMGFAGFELVLDERFLEMQTGTKHLPSTLERSWAVSLERCAVFTVGIRTSDYGQVAELSVYRLQDSRWLPDMDLLTGEFCEALGMALENCLLFEPILLKLQIDLSAQESSGPVKVFEDA